ncbi:MAG TPA: hypothetical protein QF753_19355 [Victivallales bacterium]|nr:hypothetical protein [Victivallales bacterium]
MKNKINKSAIICLIILIVFIAFAIYLSRRDINTREKEFHDKDSGMITSQMVDKHNSDSYLNKR